MVSPSLKELYLHGNGLKREPVGVRRLNRIGQLRECQLGLWSSFGSKLRSRFIDANADSADSRDPRRILKGTFAKYDRDRSGTIDAAEFAALCRDLGMALSPEEVDDALTAMDTNGDGSVDWEEFCYFFESF